MNWTRCTAAIGGQRNWREGKSSPYTGKLSARPAGKPGDYSIVKENLRRSLPHHSLLFRNCNEPYEAPRMRF